MKIVLPLAGKGVRLLPHTKHTPKPLMFTAGKTILDYLMDELIALNPTEFVFIVGYQKENIQQHLSEKYPDIPIKFIEQINPQGLGHAIYQARDAFSKDEEMLVILGDQTFSIEWKKMIQNSYNRISVVEVKNPSNFGVVTLDNNGFVSNMEEKPDHPKSNLAISGTYYFPSAHAVFSAIAHQTAKNIRTKGEIQITDSMRIMMEMGEKFETLNITDWNDCGNHNDLIKANETLLKKHGSQYQHKESVTFIEPVWIHPNAIITNSTIGPNVSIAENVEIINSKLDNTIVDQHTKIMDSILSTSYIGQNMTIENVSSSEQFLA